MAYFYNLTTLFILYWPIVPRQAQYEIFVDFERSYSQLQPTLWSGHIFFNVLYTPWYFEKHES